MQLKYSFKKEWSHFLRTFRFAGILIALISLAFSNPMMYKFAAIVLDTVGLDTGSGAAIVQQNPSMSMQDIFGQVDMEDILAVYSDAGTMFSMTISTFPVYGLLIIMLLLMSAAGGEQKKRAMIVPMCSGLQYKNYLIPKFTIYPLTVFCGTLVSSVIAGLLCNAMFANHKTSVGFVFIMSLLISVYMAFMTCVFLSIGLCSSKPGVMTPLLFVGQLVVSSMLSAMGLSDYHPFALLDFAGGKMLASGFSLSESMPSILVSAALAIVIAVMMYFLALGVLGAKKIDNQAEKEPEF